MSRSGPGPDLDRTPGPGPGPKNSGPGPEVRVRGPQKVPGPDLDRTLDSLVQPPAENSCELVLLVYRLHMTLMGLMIHRRPFRQPFFPNIDAPGMVWQCVRNFYAIDPMSVFE